MLHRPARGISPVEMLIALGLSLALIAGLGRLAVGGDIGSRSENARGQTQDAGRLAMELLGRELRKAGYRSDRQLADALLFPAVAPFGAGAVISGDDQSVTIRYLGGGDAWTRDCLGATVASGATAVQTLSVASGELRCQARNLATGSDQTQALMANVEAIGISYGVDTDGDSYPDRYVSAGAVSDWRTVTSLNLQLRTASTAPNVQDTDQPYIDFSGQRVTPSDKRVRRSYSMVVALRNRLP